MQRIPGRRAAAAVGGSLALVLSQSPGMAIALPGIPAVVAGSVAEARECAVPGTGPGLHSGIPTPEGYSPTRGTVSALTLFVDFPDAEAQITTEERLAEFFPATSEYFAASSYGALDYRPAPVHGWLRMPQPFEAYGIDRGVGWHPGDPQGYNRLMHDIVAALDRAAGEGGSGTGGAGDRDGTPVRDGTGARADNPAPDSPAAAGTSAPAPPAAEDADTAAAAAGTVAAPGTAPGTATAAGDGRGVELAAADVDFSAHDLVNVLAAPNAGPPAVEKVLSVSFPGRPLIPTATGPLHNVSFIWSSQPGHTPHRVLVHENGHAFGLPDLYWTGEGPSPELTGHWDVMEQDWGPSNDILAWHKWKMGWLTDGEVDCVPGPGVTEHTITPLGAAATAAHHPAPAAPEPAVGVGTGLTAAPGTDAPRTRLVTVPLGPSEVLTLEVRAPSELDEAVCRPGVLLARVDTHRPSGEGPVRVVDATPGSDGCLELPDPQVTPGLSDAPHRPGETFRDEEAGVSVEVTGVDADGNHTVRVTRW
ncbi:M6 family metalloprotease domain-containing protein [Streptomyces bohaiensis]|uniref:M6 family metalloprotease domain-containing protein n=1 Tax=Streptomyces bohaiensis TaxID=1431344 RepID=UPI001ADD7B75|nr:M6 family metalloprotease domain-containing protein [Streptomyces bohaiensis]